MAEPTPETITLPKSGLVLTKRKGWSGHSATLCPRYTIDIGRRWDLKWVAWVGSVAKFVGPYVECLAWLDARVLELRAALLPPGAIVVADTEETVEAARRAVLTAERSIASDCTCGDQGLGPCSVCNNRDSIIARAVLAALREARA